jgi:hypothetical protein
MVFTLEYVKLFERLGENTIQNFTSKCSTIVWIVKGGSGRLSGPARIKYTGEIPGEEASPSRDLPLAFHFKAVRLSLLVISQCEHPNICNFCLHNFGPFVRS